MVAQVSAAAAARGVDGGVGGGMHEGDGMGVPDLGWGPRSEIFLTF